MEGPLEKFLISSRSFIKHGRHMHILFLIGLFLKKSSPRKLHRQMNRSEITDRNEMSNLSRGHSIDATYLVFVHLAMLFQSRRFFRNRPIRNKICMCRPCLITNRGKMSNFSRGPSIDASYLVSLQLTMRFQRR